MGFVACLEHLKMSVISDKEEVDSKDQVPFTGNSLIAPPPLSRLQLRMVVMLNKLIQ